MASIVVSGDTSGAVTITAPAIAGTTTLTLPTTSGTLVVTGGAQTIEFADGTVSAPSITNSGDTNTGIYFPAADTIAFTEGGVESMRIDSSGNVGIGTSSPTTKVVIADTAPQLRVQGGSGAGGGGYIGFQGQGATTGYVGTSAGILGGSDTSNDMLYFAAGTTLTHRFFTNSSERMRIDSSGNVLIGTTSNTGSRKVNVVGSIASTFSDANDIQAVLLTDANTVILASTYGTTGSYKPLAFNTGGSERMRIDSSGRVGIGTSSPATTLDISATTGTMRIVSSTGTNGVYAQVNNTGGSTYFGRENSTSTAFGVTAYSTVVWSEGAYPMVFATNNTERMRITSGGDVLVGTTTAAGTDGITLRADTSHKYVWCSHNNATTSAAVYYANRQNNDGDLFQFRQADVTEGSISVSGTTVSYNGGHLSRYAQTVAEKDDSLLKGTVLSNLDEMNEYVDAEGNSVANEQLNKVKVSDVEGDVNVAGVFVNWSHDEAHNVDEINMAMTGDMIIRIAQGVVVQKGDLLMSAGDGTAKPQGDDIVRSKTVAKVTSNHVTCTYADGSYCVPCVLMAC